MGIKHDLEKLEESIYKCARCGYCRQWSWKEVGKVCPVLDFVPGWETNYARGHIWQAINLLKIDNKQLEPNITEKKLITNAFLKDAFQCTLCGSCEAHCPMEVPLLEIYEAIRSNLVSRGYAIPSHEALEFAIPALNPGAPSSSRPLAESLIKAQNTRPQTADVLYYPGCTTATKTHEIPNAVISILEKLNVNYTVLTKDEESCCGLPFYEVGQMEWFEDVAKNTVEYVERHKPKVVITTCSGCYKFLSKIYPEELGVEWSGQIIHFTEYIQPLLEKHKSRLKPLNLNITYHDPCTLGRGSGLYEPPRTTIKSLPGVQITEMSNIKENQVCCGAGGGVGAAYPTLALNMAKLRLKQAEETGAQALISSCAGCKTNFIAAKDDTNSKMEILDIAELIDKALSN